MKKFFLTTVSVCTMISGSFAQLSSERPASTVLDLTNSDVPVVIMPPIDVDAILAEEALNDKAGMYKYGETIDANVTSADNGQWMDLGNGERLWRVGIQCDYAFSVDLNFSQVTMSDAGKLWIYSEDGTELQGPFTNKDLLEDGSFGSYPIGFSKIYVEYIDDVSFSDGLVAIDGVTHGFRDLFSSQRGGGSGACNNNVACPEGDPWIDEIRSVAIIISGGGGACTGTMVNNTAQDLTPYFLTADHCIDGANVGSWRFKFNYQATNCNGSGAPNLGGGQFTIGSEVRANKPGSDMALLELDNVPPPTHNVYYSGWDNSGDAPSNSTAIHHPSGDIKKISFDEDNATTANFSGAQCWHIADWEDGTTEPGSSGSGLWNEDHRLIGQLYGGSANCNFNFDDFYGRFDVSWNGSSSSNRLRDWLDPTGSGVETLDGMYDPANSIADVNLSADINLFPNPTNGIMIVTVPSALRNATVEVLNMMGQVVVHQNLSNQTKASFDLSELEGGHYSVQFYTKSAVASKRVVLIK